MEEELTQDQVVDENDNQDQVVDENDNQEQVVDESNDQEQVDVIANMTNLADSGQDDFVRNWAEMARIMLYEQGVSRTFLESNDAQYILAKAVTDLVEDGNLSNTTLSLLATLRINHPHAEDNNV